MRGHPSEASGADSGRSGGDPGVWHWLAMPFADTLEKPGVVDLMTFRSAAATITKVASKQTYYTIRSARRSATGR
jgi:hypothetical protein